MQAKREVGRVKEGLAVTTSPTSQDPVLRLDLRRLEDGKGKSPYDPRHQAASVLVGESKGWDPPQNSWNPSETLELDSPKILSRGAGIPHSLTDSPGASRAPEHPAPASDPESLQLG